MRVARSRTYETKKGVWEKIEVELDHDDLLPDELAAAPHAHPQLLENRIEKHLTMSLLQYGQLTQDEAAQRIAELDAFRKSLLNLNPPKLLKRRGLNG